MNFLGQQAEVVKLPLGFPATFLKLIFFEGFSPGETNNSLEILQGEFLERVFVEGSLNEFVHV